MRVSLLVLLVALLPGMAAPARAQIYSWRDADGGLVLSDKPRSGQGVRSFAVTAGEPIRTTRAPNVSYKQRFDGLIEKYAATYRVPASLVRAVVQVESGFNPLARSPKGAMGLMQLMPGTARELGVVNPLDPEQNIRGGVAYLRQLLTRYDEDQVLALAAYNAGPEAVQRYGNQVPPYAETRKYVQKVTDRTGLEAPRAAAGTQVYTWVEMRDGRPLRCWSDKPPRSGEYDIVPTRR